MKRMMSTLCLVWLALGLLCPRIGLAGAVWGESEWGGHCKSVRTSYNPDSTLSLDELTIGIYDPRWEDFVFWAIINGIPNRRVEKPVSRRILGSDQGGGIRLRWAPGTRWERVGRYSYGYAVALLVGEHGWRDVQFADYFAARGGTYDYNLKDRLYLLDPQGRGPWDEFLSALGDSRSRYFSYSLAQPVLVDLSRERIIYRGGQGVAYEVSYERFLVDLKEVLSDCSAYEFFQDYDTYGQGFASRPGWSGRKVSAGSRLAYKASLGPVETSQSGDALENAVSPPVPGEGRRGASIYAEQCAVCHGPQGRGGGLMAASIKPPPRDFSSGLFKIRSTPSGKLPTDEDLMRVVAKGLPGTAMPGWSQFLSREEIEQVVSYLKQLSGRFNEDVARPPIALRVPAFASGETLLNGARQWRRLGCAACHGKDGRGGGSRAFGLVDHRGRPILPTDLSNKWLFRGGYRPEAVYQRLAAGIDGTPMGSYLGRATERELWELVFYVLDLSPVERPQVRKRATDTPP